MHKETFKKYLSSEKRFSPHTVISYYNDVNQFSLFLFDEYQIKSEISEVNFHMVRSWITTLLEKGLSARSIHRKISTLKTYFRFLEREGVINDSPMLKVVAPKSKRKLPLFVEEEQIRFLTNCKIWIWNHIYMLE